MIIIGLCIIDSNFVSVFSRSLPTFGYWQKRKNKPRKLFEHGDYLLWYADDELLYFLMTTQTIIKWFKIKSLIIQFKMSKIWHNFRSVLWVLFFRVSMAFLGILAQGWGLVIFHPTLYHNLPKMTPTQDGLQMGNFPFFCENCQTCFPVMLIQRSL